MPTPTGLREIERAVRGAWGADVCEDPADVPRWSPSNPSRGQCGPTALVLNDLLGGDLCVAEVRLRDGTQQGFHWWNRLAGVDVDLTREQFGPGRPARRSAERTSACCSARGSSLRWPPRGDADTLASGG
jgi:hypothetical protein